MTVMRDVAIVKSEFVEGEKAITKLQDFQMYEPLFAYCVTPQVGINQFLIIILINSSVLSSLRAVSDSRFNRKSTSTTLCWTFRC